MSDAVKLSLDASLYEGRDLFAIPERQSRPGCAVLPSIQSGLERAFDGVAFVCAPAGYGKTTQVALWAGNESRDVVWADLGQSDNDSQLLAAKLTLMLQRHINPGGREADLRTADAHPLMALTVVTAMVRAMTRPLVMVFDDVHEIDDTTALDLLGAVVSNMPAGATVILIGRSEPALNLASLWVDRRIVELAATDLALTTADAGAIFESVGLEVDDAHLEQYVEETEGWPVGLQLAAHGLRDDAELPPGALARDRILAGLVHDQWLRGLDADDMDFLLRVSGFDWMSGQLCDEVLERSDSGARLERLYWSRLLVIPLDRRGDAFRLHSLLRDVLDADFERLDRTARRDIDRRATSWFERHGDIDRAVHHAVRAGDERLVEELVVRYAVSVHTRGGFKTVCRWLDQIPVTRTRNDPALCLVASLSSVGLGQGDEARAWVRLGIAAARSATGNADNSQTYLELLTLESMLAVGPINDVLANATRAYEQLPAGVWHSAAGLAVGFFHLGLGLDDLADAKLVEAAAEAHVLGAATVWAASCALLAVIKSERGEWVEATKLARDARQIAREHGLENMPTMAVVTAMSAHVEALAGNTATARADVLLTRRNMAYIGGIGAWVNVQSRLSLAHASLLMGDRSGARVLADEAEAYLMSQSDATGSRERLDEIVKRLEAARGALPVGPMALTTAELRVLHLLPTNLSLADIAQRLYVSRNTTKSHTASVYRKLGVSSRAEAVRMARDVGLLPPLP